MCTIIMGIYIGNLWNKLCTANRSQILIGGMSSGGNYSKNKFVNRRGHEKTSYV